MVYSTVSVVVSSENLNNENQSLQISHNRGNQFEKSVDFLQQVGFEVHAQTVYFVSTLIKKGFS